MKFVIKKNIYKNIYRCVLNTDMTQHFGFGVMRQTYNHLPGTHIENYKSGSQKNILHSGIHKIIMTNKSYNLAIVLLLSTTLDLCYGHGYMSSPRSRQLVAFEVNIVHQIFHVGTIF